MHEAPFADYALSEMRRTQSELLLILPDDVRETLLPDIDDQITPPAGEYIIVERALRERVEDLIGAHPHLAEYLERARRHRFATAIVETVEARYRELAGDTPMAMDLELEEAKTRSDPTVAYPSYEEQTAVARIVPMIAWADFLRAQAASHAV